MGGKVEETRKKKREEREEKKSKYNQKIKQATPIKTSKSNSHAHKQRRYTPSDKQTNLVLMIAILSSHNGGPNKVLDLRVCISMGYE